MCFLVMLDQLLPNGEHLLHHSAGGSQVECSLAAATCLDVGLKGCHHQVSIMLQGDTYIQQWRFLKHGVGELARNLLAGATCCADIYTAAIVLYRLHAGAMQLLLT